MPFTAEGCGTRYVGKKNLTTRRGVCGQCEREAELKSYDTRLWICVLFIAIIPLGRKHVRDECPLCSAHRVARLDQWHRGTHETLAEATRKAQESPRDVEAHINLHRLLHLTGKKDEAAQLAEALPEMFPDSADVHVHLAAWCYEAGNTDEERRHLESALEIDPDCRDARRALATALLEEGNVGRARELVAFALEPGADFDARLCFMVAQGHMKADEPAPAMELLECALEAQPSLGQDRTFRQAARKCEKKLGRETSILPRHAGLARLAAAVAVIILIAAAVLAGMSVWKRGNQTLHVVNGLAAPVEIRIDDDPPQRFPPGRTPHAVGEGDHTALITMPDGERREVPFTVDNGFGQRLSGGNVFILNVAGAGTLLERQVVYADKFHNPEPPGNWTHWRDEFIVLRDIDYPFVSPPESMSADLGSDPIRKKAVELVQGAPLEVVQYALADAPLETQLDFIEHHLRLNPDNDGLLQSYFAAATRTGHPDRCREFLSEGLAARPVRGKWHGLYQQCCIEAGDLQEVERQYRQMLAEEPDSAILAYLTARVASDEDECERLLDQALEGDPAIAGAWAYKATIAASQGRLQRARELAEAGLRVAPDRFDISQLLFRIRFALGDYEALEEDLGREIAAGGSGELAARLRLTQVLGAAGKLEEARADYDDMVRYVDATTEGDPYKLKAANRADLCYLAGDREGCLAAARELAQAPVFYPHRFWALLGAGELDQAAACVPLASRADAPGYLLVLVLARRRAGDADGAAAAMDQALAALGRGGYSEQRLARLLQADGEIDRDLLDAVVDCSDCKAVALVLLAEKHPEQAPELLDLARTLSGLSPYTRHFLGPFIAAARQQDSVAAHASPGPDG